jgi:hypothetical protein
VTRVAVAAVVVCALAGVFVAVLALAMAKGACEDER